MTSSRVRTTISITDPSTNKCASVQSSNVERLESMDILKRRLVLRQRCLDKRSAIQEKEDFARAQGFASYKTYERILKKKATKARKSRSQSSWNHASHLGARGYKSYNDGRELYDDLSNRNAYSIRDINEDLKDEDIDKLLPRPPTDETEVSRHIHTNTGLSQNPLKDKVLNELDKQIGELELNMDELLSMTKEEYHIRSFDMGDDYEHEDMEELWQRWEREVKTIKRLKNKEIEDKKQELAWQKKHFEELYKNSVATELRKENAKHRYTELCRQQGMFQIKSLLDQIGKPAIQLNGYGLSSAHFKVILECITPETRLLSLEENSIVGYGLDEAFADLFTRTDIDMRKLYLRNNSLGTLGGIAVMKGVYLCRYKCLNEILLDSNKLGSQHGQRLVMLWKYIVEACTFSGNRLKRLGLADNKLDYRAGQYLSNVLKSTNCMLKELNLGFNNLQDKGLLSLLEGLELNQSLRRLDLEMTGIQVKSQVALASTISKEFCNLEVLTLSHNLMLSSSVNEISNGIQRNSSLKQLHLRGCGIHGNDLATVIKAAQTRTKLQITLN